MKASGLISNKEVLQETWDHVQEVQDGRATGVYLFGHPEFDRFSPLPGEVVVIGGYSSNGKTLLAENIADQWSRHLGIHCLFNSLEMTPSAIQLRNFAAAAGRPVYDLMRRGQLDAGDYGRIAEMVECRRGARLDWIRAPTVEQTCSTARRLAAKGLKVVFIDYVQIMRTSMNRGLSTVNSQEHIMTMINDTAKDTGVVFVVLSQMRKSEDGKEERPRLGKLLGASGFRNTADIICLVHRPGYGTNKPDDTIELVFGKHRSAAAGFKAELPFENGRILGWSNS